MASSKTRPHLKLETLQTLDVAAVALPLATYLGSVSVPAAHTGTVANGMATGAEVDLYWAELRASATLTAATAGVNPAPVQEFVALPDCATHLRVFDAAGRWRPITTLAAPRSRRLGSRHWAGEYFVGVSGAGNNRFRVARGDWTVPGSTGLYFLSVRLANSTAPSGRRQPGSRPRPAHPRPSPSVQPTRTAAAERTRPGWSNRAASSRHPDGVRGPADHRGQATGA